MRTVKFLTAFLFVAVTAAVTFAQPGEKVAIVETYKGTVPNNKKPDIKTGFVATEGEWAAVWALVNPNEKQPAVDFTKHILLVSTQDAADPNKTNASVVKDKKGTAYVSVITTLIGFENSDKTIYRFHKVSRDGITGVRYHAPGKKGPEVHPLPK